VAHLDTAYKLGSYQAQYDFQAEFNKIATGEMSQFFKEGPQHTSIPLASYGGGGGGGGFDQAALTRMALDPSEEISLSGPMARTQPGGEMRAPAGMVPRSGGPGETLGMGGSLGGGALGKAPAPFMGLGGDEGAGAMAAHKPLIEAGGGEGSLLATGGQGGRTFGAGPSVRGTANTPDTAMAGALKRPSWAG